MWSLGWRRFLKPNFSQARAVARRRHKRASASAELPAEVLETRVLLSATSATHLLFTVQPTNGTAGASFSVSVSVENSSGTVVMTNDSMIRLTLRGPGNFAGNGRSMTATAAGGVATFNGLTLDKAGTYTLEASIGHRHRVSSDSFVIAPDTSGPEKLAFLRQDSTRGTVGEPLRNVAVAVEDQYGNIIKTDDSSVTLTVNSGPATSFDSSTPSPYTVSTANGVARFDNAILDTAGTYTLAASDSNSAVTSAVSGSITIHAQGQHGNGRHDGDFFGFGDHNRF